MKHWTPLAYDQRGKSAFESSPTNRLNGVSEFLPCEFQNIQTNSVLQRFHDISLAFLNSDLHQTYASTEACLTIAKAKRLPKSKGRRQILVSDIARDCLPRFWLDRNYPGIFATRIRREFRLLDDNRETFRSPMRIALILALLFESADAAIRHWESFKTGDALCATNTKPATTNLKKPDAAREPSSAQVEVDSLPEASSQ
jgi:hypothetical protein